MPRIAALEPQNAPGKSKDLLEGVSKKLGFAPNMMRTMAHSPTALQAYLGLSGALAHGAIPAKVHEQFAVLSAEENACDYCLAAHSAIGKSVGLSSKELIAARRGDADDPKAAALLKLGRQVLATQGAVSNEDLAAARKAGVTDAELVELVAHVALNVLTNYFNRFAETEVDFPAPDEAVAA